MLCTYTGQYKYCNRNQIEKSKLAISRFQQLFAGLSASCGTGRFLFGSARMSVCHLVMIFVEASSYVVHHFTWYRAALCTMDLHGSQCSSEPMYTLVVHMMIFHVHYQLPPRLRTMVHKVFSQDVHFYFVFPALYSTYGINRPNTIDNTLITP